ncbi:MAG: hypothetical protein KBF88_08255 [Polyangiaceae bacterium]|nr:hypothetical protein [Polyangiaceae bacterium]
MRLPVARPSTAIPQSTVPIVERPKNPYVREVMFASVSLLVFVALNLLLLAARFSVDAQPWKWRSVFAIVTTVLALIASAVIWRFPSRGSLFFGIAVVVLSLVRYNYLGGLGLQLIVPVGVTLGLLAPIVYAFTKVE